MRPAVLTALVGIALAVFTAITMSTLIEDHDLKVLISALFSSLGGVISGICAMLVYWRER